MNCKKLTVFLSALALLAIAAPLFAEDFPTEIEKKIWQDAQGDPGNVNLTPLNCEGAIPIACGQSLAGTTIGAANQTSTYNCTTFTEGGGEAIYVFTLATQQYVTIGINSGSPDLDMLLLSACDNTACLAGSFGGTTTADAVTMCLNAGTYYGVVDGFGTTTP